MAYPPALHMHVFSLYHGQPAGVTSHFEFNPRIQEWKSRAGNEENVKKSLED